MNIALPFIKRPVMTTLVMFAILLAGIMGYRLLPVSDLPNVDFPTISVSANLPGASPETMASSVATPLEREFSTIPGIDSMVSSSSKGSTQITLQFALDRDIDAAAQDVQSAISSSLGDLPSDMPSPPRFRKVNPAESPILFLALTSDNMPLSKITEYGDTFLAQRISMVQGVAQVSVRGSQKYAVRVQLDPKTLASREIGVNEVAEAVRGANVNMPSGDLEGIHRTYTIESEGQLLQAEDYRPIIVSYRDGKPVRLESLGRVINSVEDDKSAGYYNERPSIVLSVDRQPGTNTVEVVDKILELLPQFRAQLPPDINLVVLFDRSVSIRHSVAEVKFTLWLTIFLVVLVIFIFIRNVSATVIPSLALPMSLIGTFAIMYLLDYSIDVISLMALTLCVGFVVDDAIVVLENIVRHMEQGEAPMEAAIKGTQEIGFTIVSMTLSLAAVFLPVLFMGGILGRLLEEFAVVIMVAILISGFISLSLTPMLCARFLRPPAHDKKHGRIYNFFEWIFDGMLKAYDVTLRFSLRHRVSMVILFFGVLAATVWLFLEIPKGFMPTEDTGRMMVSTQAAQGTSFEEMLRMQQEVGRILMEDPAIESISNSAGGDNNGRAFVALKPYEERDSAEEVVERLRPKLGTIPGLSAIMQIPPTIRIGGRLSRSLFQFTLQSPDIETLYDYAPLLEARLRQEPGFLDVDTDMKLDNPQISVSIDRAKAATLGLNVREIEEALYSAYGSRRVSTIYASNNTYDVIMELDPRHQQDAQSLDELYVRAPGGRLVPLQSVAQVVTGVGPLSVNHQGQLAAVTLSFNLAPGVALGDAVARVEQLAREELPGSITTSFQGTAQVFQESLKGLGLLLLLSILVIYIVLGILYESFIHPITILSGLPSAGFGALGTLWIAGMELNLYSFVGIIMLVGIVKKNAIMMIDFALEEQKKENTTPMEAIYRGCLVRFRPIMMTTAAALMGAIPIALGAGAGMEARRPLGMAIVGGLVFSQFLTLYITPVFYTYFEAMRENFARRKSRGRNHQADTAPPPASPTPAPQPNI